MIAVDTNVLVYAEGLGDPSRIATARTVLDAIPNKEFVVPIQVLVELAHVLSRKASLSPPDVQASVGRWGELAILGPTMGSTFSGALLLATERRLQIFDAIVLTASAEAGCRLLLSEDMQDGFVWRGVTVANPFAATPHPMLADLLRN